MHNKYDLSVIIPARNEIFLKKTIEDILENKQGKTQIIVGLDGCWPIEPLEDHPDVIILHYSESIGQRAITNRCVSLSSAKFILKCDAHCAFDKGFDVKMIKAFDEVGDNVIMAPTMRNLHVFNWKCKNNHIRYQGQSGVCTECGEPTEMDIVWIAKTNPQSTAYCFDSEPHFQYFNELKKKQVGDIVETMSLQGSCFMLTREKYWELKICDENFGSWGSQGIEIACKFWLSGGRVLVNRRTFYAHCFRTAGGDFGFPYENPGRAVENAKKFAKDLFFNNKWDKQIYPLSWLLEKFWPVNGWNEEQLLEAKKAGSAFTNLRSKELGILSVVTPVPCPVTDHTSTVSFDGIGQEVSVPTMSLSEVSGCGSVALEDIVPVGDKIEVGGITTPPIVTDMMKNGNVTAFSSRDRGNHPYIHKSVDDVESFVDSNLSISVPKTTSPIPTAADTVNVDFLKDSVDRFGGNVHNTIIPQKAILYYTDNMLNIKLAKKVRKYISASGLPITSVSLKKMDFGKNIHLHLKRGVLTMFKQILAGLEAMTEDIIFFCEHDVIYHKSHFDFVPEKKDVFYYNENNWRVREDGFAVYFDHDSTSQLCAYRELLIKEYRERVRRIELEGWHHNGYEPGTRPISRGGFSDNKSERWRSKEPNIDIRHDNNFTENRWSQDKFRDKSTCQNWQESNINNLWAKDIFNELH